MRISSFWKAVFAGALMGAMLAFPRQAADSARDALDAFAGSVLPALLPFSACALLLTAGKTLPPALLALLSLPGGSPAGARLFQDAGLSPAAARRYAYITGGMTPAFLLYTLAEWTGSPAAGRVLLAAHWGAALLGFLLFAGEKGARVSLPPLSLPQALAQSAGAMGTVAACVALGAVSARMAGCALPLPTEAQAAVQCLLEVTGGCRALTALGAPLPMIAGAVSFTGGAILLQNAAFWRRSGLGIGTLAALGLLRGGLAFLLCALLVHLRLL